MLLVGKEQKVRCYSNKRSTRFNLWKLIMNILEIYRSQNKPIKLNLGCYDKKFPDYINIDVREDTKCDLVDNVITLDKVPDNSCDLIEAIHVLEHFSYRETEKALSCWFSKLKVGGIVRIAVPDMEKVCALFLATKDKDMFKSSFWGSQKHDFDYHRNGFTEESLGKDLIKAGFKNPQRWDWQTTYPHNYVDSYASSYFPPMRKKFLCANGKEVDLGGVLISLNMQGVK